MDLPIVTVSEAERAQGALTLENTHAAIRALHEAGSAVLRGVFPLTAIDALHREFTARHGHLDLAGMTRLSERSAPNPVQKVGDSRFEIALRLDGLFGQPGLFANPILTKLLGPLLGHNLMRLASVTSVASYPGATAQHVHRDHQQLFHEFANIGPALPLYAVNVSVPLIDIDQVTGPTAIWPGSHRWQDQVEATPEGRISIPFQRGDCVLMDYRTMHTGMPNNSQALRPILYLVYTREWFFDDNNHRTRAPLDITLEELDRLPQEVRLLMLRAQQNALRAQQMAPA